MTSKSGVRFADRIDGQRVVRGCVHNIDGTRVRFHAITKWHTLYWSADAGRSFHKDKTTALRESTTLDTVEG